MLCIVLLFFGTIRCSANQHDASEADSLLKTAHNVVNLRAIDAKPFEMNVSFTAHVRDIENGHFTLKWAKKDLWSEEVTLGEYHELDVRKGDILYISRNLPFTNLRFGELKVLLEIVSLDSQAAKFWDAAKVKTRSRDGVREECIEFHLKRGVHGSLSSSREICVDASSKAPVSEKHQLDEDHISRYEFADYQPFHDHLYPRMLKHLENGVPVITAQVVTLNEASFDDRAFVAPPGATERRQCDQGMTPPVGMSMPDPEYPQLARNSPTNGTSILSITILADGTVDNPQVIGSTTPEMDAAAKQAVSKWKFKPAMCGAEPMTVDVHVEVNFRR